jgi:hypothetical protein
MMHYLFVPDGPSIELHDKILTGFRVSSLLIGFVRYSEGNNSVDV